MERFRELALTLLLAGAPAGGALAADDDLDALVTEYFRTDSASDRGKLLGRISRLPGADVKTVSAAIGRINLWSPADAGMQSFDLPGSWGEPAHIHVRVPQSYDASKRYPMVLCLHGQGGNAVGQIEYLTRILGDAADRFVLAAAQDYKGAWFGVTEAEAEQPAAILKDLRRRFHLDTDRTYVLGYSMGGHGAFHTATLYTDWFAAAVALAGTFPTQGIPELDSVLLPNLAGFPMLVVWGELDTRDQNQEHTKSGGIAGLNRTLRTRLPEMGAKEVEFIELPGVPHAGVVPPRDRLTHYLELAGGSLPKEVDHWFRYPVQGRRGWLRAGRFAGEPWQGTQLVIKVPPGEDLPQYARRTVRSKLANIRGKIEGQTIRVTMQKLQEVEVLLNDEIIDYSQPVTIYRGKKVVYDGMILPSLSTLLRTANEDWEFQRLFSARVIVPSRSKVRAGDLGRRRDTATQPRTEDDEADEP